MNTLVHKFAIIALLFLGIGEVNAQFQLGGNPSGQKWQIMSSPATRVIFPKGMESQAERIINLTSYVDSNNRRSIGDKHRRIDIVLQNKTVNPNGYVALAPFRSEFYATPPASNYLLGSADWLDVLAIHEYRHVLQSLNQKRGIVKFLYYLQGEKIWSGLNAVAIPSWNSEGDAVIMETALSNTGRGRSSFFTLEQRALALSDINYSYQKHRNDSYKDYLPDQYRLGYMMLTKVRNDFGNDMPAEILADAAKFKGLIYPFSRSLKRHTGMNSKRLYQAAWEEKKANFAAQLKNTNLIENTVITEPSPKVYTEYRFPNVTEDAIIYVRKSSFKTTTEIVKIKEGKEEKITTIGFNNDNSLHYSSGLLTWTELTRDARRENQDYSDIVVYDLNKKKKTRLTKHTKYFSPAISPDGSKIAAIHITPEQKNEIHILNAVTGKVEQTIGTSFNYFLSRLAWTNDGNEMITIVKNNSQLALIKITLKSNEFVELTDWTSHVLESPKVYNNRIYYTASYSGIDNIYSVDINGSKEIQQISSVAIGAFEPAIDSKNKEIVYTQFNNNGYHLVKQKIGTDNSRSTLFTYMEPMDMAIYNTTAISTEGGNILDKKIATISSPIKPYNGLFRGMKLHSWSVSPSIKTPSLNISAVNLLRDVELEAGATLNRNENNGITYNANLLIARYFPEITLSTSQGERNTDYYSAADTLSRQNFNESALGAKVAIPLGWTKGNFATQFTPSISFTHRNLNNIENEVNSNLSANISELKTGLSFSTLRRRAYQNLGTRLGFSIEGQYWSALGGKEASKQTIESGIYLPGLGKNHFLKITGAFQKENLTNLYQFTDEFQYARGFKSPINDEYQLLRADYAMPLFYPDKGIPGITQFKRVSLNLFYDYGRSINNQLNQTLDNNSVGFEILFDNTILNFIPIRIGLRNSILLNNSTGSGNFKFEPFVSINM